MDGHRAHPTSSGRAPERRPTGDRRDWRGLLASAAAADDRIPDASGTFRAAGCGPLQPGTAHAFGDRIPVPDGVERPRPHENVPGRDDMSPDARSAPTSTACLHPPEPHIQPHQHEGPVAVGLSTNHNRPRERTLNRPSAAA